MASKMISDLTSDATPAAGDLLVTVDVSDTTENPAGSNKKATLNQIFTNRVITNPTITTLITPTSNDGAALGTGTLMFSDLFLASGGVVNHNNGSTTMTGGVNIFTFGGSGANGNGIVLPAGGTSIAPLVFTAGTNLSSAAAGANEFDGKVFYTTPVASARGLSPSMMYSRVPAGGFSLLTTSGVQSCFPTTGDVWTLAASTGYYFDGIYRVTHSTTTCTLAMAFATGGGGSITSIMYQTTAFIAADNASSTSQTTAYIVTNASTVVAPTTTANWVVVFSGILNMNAAGTITPQINFSANTTAPTMGVDSYIRFTPFGTNTATVLGNVA